MEEQFIHFSARPEMELHPEALKLVDDEGSALVGTEFVGWLAPNCQRELSIVVLPDNNSRDSLAERAGAVLTEGRIRAIAGWNAGEDDVFHERLERSRQKRTSAGLARRAFWVARNAAEELLQRRNTSAIVID